MLRVREAVEDGHRPHGCSVGALVGRLDVVYVQNLTHATMYRTVVLRGVDSRARSWAVGGRDLAPSTAAIVLLAAALIVLAFGMAGVWMRVRVLERRLAQLSVEGARSLQTAGALRPSAGSEYNCVLLISRSCPHCADAVATFASHARAIEDIELTILSRVEVDLPDGAAHLGRVDPAAFTELDPGWQPAIVVLDSDGKIVTTQPAGSEAAIRSVVAEVVQRAEAARRES